MLYGFVLSLFKNFSFLLIMDIFKHSEKLKELYGEHPHTQHFKPVVINILPFLLYHVSIHLSVHLSIHLIS